MTRDGTLVEGYDWDQNGNRTGVAVGVTYIAIAQEQGMQLVSDNNLMLEVVGGGAGPLTDCAASGA